MSKRKLLVLSMLAAICGTTGAGAAEPEPAVTSMEIAGPVLMVTDLERSLKFYIQGLGMTLGTRLPGSPGEGATVTAASGTAAPFLLLRQKAAAVAEAGVNQGDGLSRVMLSVADAAAIAARLDANGYPHTVISSRKVFFVTDPDGYRFEIIQRRTAH